MSEINPSDYMIPVQAELLPDGSVKIHETILRGGQLTLLAKVFEDGCMEFIGDAHVDDYIGKLYIVAAINEDGE